MSKSKTNNKLNRRELLLYGALSYGGIGLRSLLTGLPAGFIAQRSLANTANTRYLIFNCGGGGDPINCNAPGTYVDGYSHPNAFETPTSLTLGSNTYQAAPIWNQLSAPLKASSNFFHLRTGTNSHNERNHLMTLFGAIKPIKGRIPEMLPSVIAHEQSLVRPTIFRSPISLGGYLRFEGENQNTFSPSSFKALFPSSQTSVEVQMREFRARQLDSIYQDIKTNGTPAQKKFLDDHAISQTKAVQLGTELATALSDVRQNSEIDKIKTAVAILALNISNVAITHINFGGDNHHDTDLTEEYNYHVSGIASLNELYRQLEIYNLHDKTTFAKLEVFGRTPFRNVRGGRDHHGDHGIMYSFGPDIKPGVIGDIRRGGRFNHYQSQGINSSSGTISSPDISGDDTCLSAAKSLMRACGINQQKVDHWIQGGKTVEAFLK